MLSLFLARPEGLSRAEFTSELALSAPAWIDLLEPTVEEERTVERLFSIDVPTREEMKKIEASNRLYEENGAIYMTATVAAKLDTDHPESTAVTFILMKDRLITNHYVDTRPFQQFIAYAERHPAAGQSSVAIFAGLLEAFVQRIADVMERVGNDLDAISNNIFARNGNTTPTTRDLRSLVERIGFNGELNSKARESLVSFGRLLMFVQQAALEFTPEQRARLRSVNRDVTALSDHASFLGGKISFLLEATLGLINVEQSNIIKIFSVAAVLFLPPTLVASIFGMNFHLLPDLPGRYSNFFFSLGLMLGSMLVTYAVFKRKKWL